MAARHAIFGQIETVWPVDEWRDVTIVAAVSGGADSVALLRLLHEMGRVGRGKIVVAHFNHGWRGDQSDDDQRFVDDLANDLSLACEVGYAEASLPTANQGDGLEAAARAVRYQFFEQVALKSGARWVATAHTADDQAETILHRILRGTGISGLAGIRRVRTLSDTVTLVRPLLNVERSQVVDYLESIGQPFRADASNTDTRFTRNRIRHKLLPQLRETYNAQVDDALRRLGSLAGELQQAVGRDVAAMHAAGVSESIGCAEIDCAAVAEHDRYLIRELLLAIWKSQGWPLQAMSYQKWEDLADVVLADSPEPLQRRDFPGGVVVERNGGNLILSREVR